MPSEDTKILGFNQYHKSDKAPFIIYSDLETLIEMIDWCKNNSEKSSTTKVGEVIPLEFLMSTTSLLKSRKKISMVCTKVKIAWKSFVNL